MFNKLHPVTQFVYFVVVIAFTITINNPFISVLSIVGGVAYSLKLKGSRQVLPMIWFSLAVIAFVSLFNMVFSHYGNDVLFKIKSIEFTLEALFYGFNQGMVLCAVIFWFLCLGTIFDSDKIIYIFRHMPTCGLIFSMVLGFIPRLIKKHTDISEAEIALRGGENENSTKQKFKNSVNSFSALVTYCLESSIITADSMTVKGYNNATVVSRRFKYNISDGVITLLTLVASFVVIYENAMHHNTFVFDPNIYIESFSIYAVLAFAVIVFLPLVIDLREDLVWKLSVSKM